jgi:transglutaminase-like putative cysteine protease
MAPDEDPEAPGSRFTLLIGLVVAEVAAAAAFGRVFRGTDIALKLCLIALVATGLAAVMVRRNILLATLVSGAALFVAIGLIVFPETTRYALPTLRTARAIGSALHNVGRDAHLTAAPALPVPSLFLAAVTAVWTAAFAAHSLAFRARSPLLSLTPLAALIAFAGVVVEDGGRPGYVLLFMLGAFLVLFGDAIRRLGLWGPITAWKGKRRFSSRTGTTARGAWRVAAAALAVALFIPWLLPGFGSAALLRLGQGSARAFSLNPIDDIRPRLLNNPDAVAFTVKAEHPTYWRTNTLDTFDGRTWNASDPSYEHAVDLIGGVVPRQVDTSLATQADLVTINERITFRGLTQPSIPIAGNLLRVSLSDGTPRYDPVTGTLISSDYTRQGMQMTATSQVVVPSPAELNRVRVLALPNDPYTRLPSDHLQELRQIATRMAGAGTTPYARVLAIQQVMRTWTYSLRVKAPTSEDALLQFLIKSHRGYCQQFAGAMAVLLRSLGYPARVAVGFQSGLFDAEAGAYRVTMADAHTWVEVRFPGYGWLAFDPTPTKSNPTIARYDAPTHIRPSCLTGICNAPSQQGSSGPNGGLVGPIVPRKGLGVEYITPTFLTPRDLPPVPKATDWRRIALLAAGAAALAALILIPIVRLVRRRWLLRRGGGPGGRVLSAYTAVLHTASDVGWGRRRAETLEEYRTRLTATVPFSNGDFDDLTALAQRAAYAGGAAGPEDEIRAQQMAKVAARDIRRTAGWLRTLTGAYRLNGSRED